MIEKEIYAERKYIKALFYYLKWKYYERKNL